jgi:hypothetical protein
MCHLTHRITCIASATDQDSELKPTATTRLGQGALRNAGQATDRELAPAGMEVEAKCLAAPAGRIADAH